MNFCSSLFIEGEHRLLRPTGSPLYHGSPSPPSRPRAEPGRRPGVSVRPINSPPFSRHLLFHHDSPGLGLGRSSLSRSCVETRRFPRPPLITVPDRPAGTNPPDPPSPPFTTFTTRLIHFLMLPLMLSDPFRLLTPTESRRSGWFVSSETWSPRVPFAVALVPPTPAPPPLRSPAAVVTLF